MSTTSLIELPNFDELYELLGPGLPSFVCRRDVNELAFGWHAGTGIERLNSLRPYPGDVWLFREPAGLETRVRIDREEVSIVIFSQPNIYRSAE